MPAAAVDNRGRFDTIGYTVYFGQSEAVSFAEVMQDFRKNAVALKVDAEAAGYSDVGEYASAISRAASSYGIARPWTISVEWQWNRCIHELVMPSDGWWVLIDHADTLNSLQDQITAKLRRLEIRKPLTISHISDDDRALTTTLAQYLKSLTLYDGSKPLGVDFPSKTGYGRCWAWWDRRDAPGGMQHKSVPRTLNNYTVARPAMRKVAADWGLEVLTT